jgi:MFS family permease
VTTPPTTTDPAATAPDADERDLRRILVVQGLRAFAYGLGSVLIGTSLARAGLSGFQVGAIFAAMLAGLALGSVAVGLWGDRFGRRRTYAALLAGVGLAGAAFALTKSFPVLVAVSLAGVLSTDPNESGPITTLEQAMIGGAPAATRLRVFGRYNAIAYLAGALGSLAAGGPHALRDVVPALPSDQRFLLAFPLLALACVWMATRLSPGVEPGVEPGVRTGIGAPGDRERAPLRVPLGRSRRTVVRLAGLFAMDAFGGGFVVQTFLVFWFERRFGAGAGLMGLVFFGAGILQAGSSLVAAGLGARIGLLNVMVFTHLPSNLLLAAVPFAPNLTVAIVLLLARFALSQMDVPTRQAYVVALVDPEERTAAAAVTNLARYAVRPAGSLGAGVLLQRVSFSAPFVVAAAVKVAYDAILFLSFRRVKPEPEPEPPPEPEPEPEPEPPDAPSRTVPP